MAMTPAIESPHRENQPPADPCLDPEELESALAPCAFVLFGATGDLTHRKLLPALYSLHRQQLLPEPFVLLAFARRDMDDAAFRSYLRDSLQKFAPNLPVDGPEWDRFARAIFYLRSTFDDPEGYRHLSARLAELDKEFHLRGNRLFYLATPPDSFSEIIRELGAAGLNKPGSLEGWARIVVEKPFGVDLASAQQLNAELSAVFQEDQIYRIDHYLGKETVQNILVLRFANQIFEPLWNSRYIERVQITVAETLGMEGRGKYFDAAGITRDMIQNHALQVLTLIAMEPPVSLQADAIRDEKVKALQSIHRFTPEDVARFTVRGQYGPGTIRVDGKEEAVPGYRQEEGVDPSSMTETYAAFRFGVENWRWAGVPFTVQAGKRLAARLTQVQIQFKAIPEVLFARLACANVKPNRLTIRIQPDEGASLEIGSKVPGPRMEVQPVRMDFQYGSAFKAPIRDAYERLLLDAIRGDASLFARNDEVEAAWAIITPILEAWRAIPCPPFPNYAAGTWGPSEAGALLTD
ncbi:MAG TPA: glucose-6-phosphate dehydrogenase [Chthonomonadaceae bacterium]|nr:glucose-6-phosphate dehydrogenase [Chthonomonadaceae bacterium]